MRVNAPNGGRKRKRELRKRRRRKVRKRGLVLRLLLPPTDADDATAKDRLEEIGKGKATEVDDELSIATIEALFAASDEPRSDTGAASSSSAALACAPLGIAGLFSSRGEDDEFGYVEDYESGYSTCSGSTSSVSPSESDDEYEPWDALEDEIDHELCLIASQSESSTRDEERG